MKRIAHLSDLHFGRTDPQVVEALLEDLKRQHPDLIIISGDLTQRARDRQFAAARAFIDRLPVPAVMVPGNHDLAPVYHPLTRLFRPRAKFRRYLLSRETLPVWYDEDIVAIGLDSTRHLHFKSGKLRRAHLERVDNVLAWVPDTACKIAFLHHPPVAAQAGLSFDTLAERGIDLILAGHVHRSKVARIQTLDGKTSLLIQASTACSTRLRGDTNGYALLSVDMPRLEVTLRGWNGEDFQTVRSLTFLHGDRGWADHPARNLTAEAEPSSATSPEAG